MSQPPSRSQPFSTAWVVIAVLVYTAMEIAIALLISPAILSGRLASPMLSMRLDILMHLASFYLGGIVVGVISPRVRLLEPAVGAFLSVGILFLTTFFTPLKLYAFSLDRLLIGGGIAFALALLGAWTGERWMGNIQETKPDSARAALRGRLWGPDGSLSGGDERWLGSGDRQHEKTRR